MRARAWRPGAAKRPLGRLRLLRRGTALCLLSPGPGPSTGPLCRLLVTSFVCDRIGLSRRGDRPGCVLAVSRNVGVNVGAGHLVRHCLLLTVAAGQERVALERRQHAQHVGDDGAEQDAHLGVWRLHEARLQRGGVGHQRLEQPHGCHRIVGEQRRQSLRPRAQRRPIARLSERVEHKAEPQARELHTQAAELLQRRRVRGPVKLLSRWQRLHADLAVAGH